MLTTTELNALTPEQLEEYRLARVWHCGTCDLDFTGGAFEHLTTVHGMQP